MKILLLLLFLGLSFCDNEDMMDLFVKCANNQVGKQYLEELSSRGPNIFSNSGLVFYCRDQAGLSLGTIYVSWKRVPNPKVGAHVFGITKDNGHSVSTESLGIIVSLDPTMVVAGDEEKGILTKHVLNPQKQFLRIEYHYVDF